MPEWLKGTDCKSVGYAYVGSNPTPSTSLRSLRELRLGRPVWAAPREASEGCRAVARRAQAGYARRMRYVYILASESSEERFYVGLTADLRDRMKRHNAGEVPHTSKFLPWKLKTYVAFSDPEQAVSFEKYLKSASGRAFAKKRL